MSNTIAYNQYTHCAPVTGGIILSFWLRFGFWLLSAVCRHRKIPGRPVIVISCNPTCGDCVNHYIKPESIGPTWPPKDGSPYVYLVITKVGYIFAVCTFLLIFDICLVRCNEFQSMLDIMRSKPRGLLYKSMSHPERERIRPTEKLRQILEG